MKGFLTDETIQAIKKHLDNKENFYYSYAYCKEHMVHIIEGELKKLAYDFSVEEQISSNSEYKAWVTQQYKKSCGGHRYALISENNAIFVENY